MDKSEAGKFKDRVRQEIKGLIARGRTHTMPTRFSNKNEAYNENFFEQLESDRISATGSFQEMFLEQQKLGEGCQSVVKKVTERSSKKEFAAKLFKKVDIEMIDRYKAVFLFMRSLNYPTIIKPHYMFISYKTNTVRVILDLIESPNLQELLDEHKVFNEDLARRLMKVLLETVVYLHSRRACHRDIKPANILYDIHDQDETSALRLIDYEICKTSRKDVLEMWTVTGSLFYKAPEMFNGSYNQKVDVWACGVICYQILHGKPPFANEFINKTIEMIQQDNVQDKLDPKLDPQTKDFIKKCLNKDPGSRLSAASALKEPFILSAQIRSKSPQRGKRVCSEEMERGERICRRNSSHAKNEERFFHDHNRIISEG